MKNNTRVHVLSCAFFLCTSSLLADVIPYISIRSQGFNAARELVNWQTLINRTNAECFYGAFSITPEYTRTFKPADIAQALFCNALTCDCTDNNRCATFAVQGTKVDQRSYNALMAENFYLPTDFSSLVTIEPRIDNFLVDFNFYLGLDEWSKGLYFRIHTPVCHTRWNLNYCEQVISPGTEPYDLGYFSGTIEGTNPNEYGISNGKLLHSFQEYIIDNRAISGVPNITFNSLERARIAKCPLVKTRLAEVTAAFGWNFLLCDDYYLGLNIRGAAPAGNRPEGCYLFEPIVGQGHHWELGGGLNAFWCMWRSTDECDNLSAYLDANVTHLFSTRQCRTFDLRCKPLSRYMLAMKFTSEVQNLVAGDTLAAATAPSAQFANEYMPVANLTTIPVDVSAAVQGDLVLKFAYTHGNFQFDLGYNFWGRSCEKICSRRDCCNNNFRDQTWALKGDSFVYGFTADAATTNIPQTPVALSATQSKADIFSGTNQWPDGINGMRWNQNPGIDNPLLAWIDPAPVGETANLFTKAYGDTVLTQVNTSLEPLFISSADFDLQGAGTKGLSNKVFTNFGYIWNDREEWLPFLGFGAEVEFGQRDDKCCCGSGSSNCKQNCCNTTAQTSPTCKPCCDDNGCGDKELRNSCCKSFAVSQWGVWVKGGVAFN